MTPGRNGNFRIVLWIASLAVGAAFTLFQVLRATDLQALREATANLNQEVRAQAGWDARQDSALARINTLIAVDYEHRRQFEYSTSRNLQLIMDELNVPRWRRAMIDTSRSQ